MKTTSVANAEGSVRRAADSAALHYVTPCSAEKDPAPGLLPALQRYRSKRIHSIHKAAAAEGAGFLIFSGRYGLLRASDPIPYYDHLLIEAEVAAHAKRVAEQLLALGATRLRFISQSAAVDPNLGPYQDCLKRAASLTGAQLEFVDLA